MAAYDAVISLSQSLDSIIYGGRPTSFDKYQLRSLRKKVSFLQNFLENSVRKTSNQEAIEILENKIRVAASRAEQRITNVHVVPETESESESKPVTRGYRVLNFLCMFLFVVFTDLIIFILVHVLLHLMKKIMPDEIASVIFAAIQISVFVAVNPILTHLYLKHVSEILAKFKSMLLLLTQIKSRNPRDVIFVEMQRVIEEMGSIIMEAEKIKDVYVDIDPDGIGKNIVVGFDCDLAEVKTQLANPSSKLDVVSIVGMGGIGKTTLARKVFDDRYIVDHFDTRAWVTISQEYTVPQVLIGLLDSSGMLTEMMYEKSEGRLIEYLHKSLKSRRYLIVMDDMWDTNIWDAVRRSFPDDNNGSRVLLTTRLSDVSHCASNKSLVYRMGFFNGDDSWNLLCNIVFGEKNSCPHVLEDIGKEIARNCGGLPLAITVIGGLLSKMSRTREYWRHVADNLSSVVAQDDEQCMEKLSLSYNHLPRCLKPCFLYMGVFPEDHEIPVSKLVRLWVAEGFIEPDGSKSLEELGEKYLEDLIERHLVLVCKRSSNGKIKTCNIHDLLRNLCMQKGETENFLCVVKSVDGVVQKGIHDTQYRLSIHPNTLSFQNDILYTTMCNGEVDNSSVHSLLCCGVRLIYPLSVYLGFTMLKVLDLIIVRFFDFPVEIIKLVHLRYLGFTYNGPLPSSIVELQNLQTIVHHNWTFGQYPFLPMEIWMMPKLRHIHVTPSCLPYPRVGNSFLLENLQTLLEVRNLKCGNGIITRIRNLKRLGIVYDVSPSLVWSEYHLETLVHLHELETLKLVVKSLSRELDITHQPRLALPQSLKRLTLSGCQIPWESMSIVGKLPNLEVLKLKINGCRGAKWDPVEDEFRQLKYLLLEELDLVQWVADDSHFPRLQRLIIRSCYKLQEIPPGIGDISTLRTIELVDGHYYAVNAAKEIADEQEENGNEDLKIVVDSRRRFKNKFYSRVLH